MEGIVTITPHENARVVVDGQPIRETYMLENSACIVLGQDTTLIFVDEYNQDSGENHLQQVRVRNHIIFHDYLFSSKTKKIYLYFEPFLGYFT